MDSDTEIVVEESFEAAAQATRERMFKLSPEERLEMTELLRKQLYPDGLEPDFQKTVEVIQR